MLNEHIAAVTPLFNKYQVTIPENDAANRVIKVSSLKEALQIGVDSEIKYSYV